MNNIMKNLFFTIFTLSALCISAQNNPCVPDVSLQNEEYNLWPDTIENLPVATVGEYYETHIQIKTPNTVGEVVGSPYEISLGLLSVDVADYNIDSIKLEGVLNLPQGMDLYLSSPTSVFAGNTVGCVTIFGTPQASDIGVNDLIFTIDGWISTVIGPFALSQTDESADIVGYNLVVGYPASVGDLALSGFGVSQNYPNPFSKNTNIDVRLDENSLVEFTLVDVLGKVKYNEIFDFSQGTNTIEFSSEDLTPGLYFYSVSNRQEIFTKRLMIAD